MYTVKEISRNSQKRQKVLSHHFHFIISQAGKFKTENKSPRLSVFVQLNIRDRGTFSSHISSKEYLNNCEELLVSQAPATHQYTEYFSTSKYRLCCLSTPIHVSMNWNDDEDGSFILDLIHMTINFKDSKKSTAPIEF